MASATSSSASTPKAAAARVGVWHERLSPTTWAIHLHRGKNVFNPTLVAELHACLSAVRLHAIQI
jgi:hypothetical protein